MVGWHVGKLLTAVEFAGSFLKLRLAVMARGDDRSLLLEIVSDPDVDADGIKGKPYAEWSPRFNTAVPKGWKPAAGNPWRSCRYSGPLRALPVGDVDGLITYVAGGGKSAGARLAALVEVHLDAPQLDLSARRNVLQFLKSDFAVAAISAIVRPEDSVDLFDLTLAAAEAIHQAAGAGKHLSATQRRQAAVLLKYAPWQFGYWGPFKALVKSVPVDSLADAYADAVARLSSAEPSASVPAKVSIENVDPLEGWFSIPTRRTQQYLARRVRRDLASLAERSPEAYARVASRMLISWDQPLSNYSYAPAFVILGAHSPLDSQSRYVRRPADMTVRRDAHPEIWDARPALVEKVFRSIHFSVTALTWAYQVLDSLGSAPELHSASVVLALESTYLPLRRQACAAVPKQSKVLENLTVDQWTAIFRDGADADVAAVADALVGRPLGVSMGTALTSVMAETAVDSDRGSQLALLYLAAPKKPFSKHGDADVAAVIAAIEHSGLEHQPLWGPVVAKMGQWQLLDVYRSLLHGGADAAALDVIARSLLAQNYHSPGLILECLGSDSPQIAQLGGRLVDAHGGRQFLFTQLLPSAGQNDRLTPEIALRVVTAALPQAEESKDVSALIRWALSAGMDHSQLAAMVLGNTFGPSAIWELLSADAASNVGRWAAERPELLQAAAESLTERQVAAATPAQLQWMLNYIAKNPGGVPLEGPLHLAALRSGEPSLQAKALRRLRSRATLKRKWLEVAESGVPEGVDAARKYLESITGAAEIRQAILECLASESTDLQGIGIELFRSRDAVAGDSAILAMLASFDDRRAQDLVADATAAGARVDDSVLQGFDRRILTDRRASHRARESVKKRLESFEPSSQPDSEERIEMVLQLARAGNKGDREWALMRLASWALHGVEIDGLEVSLTTKGFVGPGDVTP